MSSPARKLDIREANEALILRAAEKTIRAARLQRYDHRRRSPTRPGCQRPTFITTSRPKRICIGRFSRASSRTGWTRPPLSRPTTIRKRALTLYITAKMQFSRQRPYGSRVWASEIMRGAPGDGALSGNDAQDLGQRARQDHPQLDQRRQDPRSGPGEPALHDLGRDPALRGLRTTDRHPQWRQRDSTSVSTANRVEQVREAHPGQRRTSRLRK